MTGKLERTLSNTNLSSHLFLKYLSVSFRNCPPIMDIWTPGRVEKINRKKEKIRLDKWNLWRYNTQAVRWTASKTGRTACKPQKSPKKGEKTSWQMVFFVVGYQSSQQSETLYLVNWITQRRTKHLWQIYGFVWSVSEKQPTKILELIARSKWFRKWFEARKRFRYNFLRVWSWLRTNAGGVPNTCKSNGVSPSGLT